MRANLLWVLPIILVSSVVGTAMIRAVLVAGDEPKTDARPIKWLDVVRVNDGPETPPLALVKVYPLHPPLTQAEEDAAIKKYKNSPQVFPDRDYLKSFTSSIGNAAFMLVRPHKGLTEQALIGEQVVGIVYAHELGPMVGPFVNWSGRLVHCRATKEIYLVLARGCGFDLTIAIFRVNPDAKIGKFPLELPRGNPNSWPKPLQPITEKVITANISTPLEPVYAIEAVPDERTLVIAAQDNYGSRPRYFRFDLGQKTWTTAKVVAGETLK